jgi:phosphopantetheine adenylyltransferase
MNKQKRKPYPKIRNEDIVLGVTIDDLVRQSRDINDHIEHILGRAAQLTQQLDDEENYDKKLRNKLDEIKNTCWRYLHRFARRCEDHATDQHQTNI